MKKYWFLIMAACLFVCNAYAQDKELETEDVRQPWKTEYSVRVTAGLFTKGPAVTIGRKLDEKWILGGWLGQGDTYYDAAPGHSYAIQTAAYTRRYFHLGGRDIIALYGELALGCDWTYKVTGKYMDYDDPDTGEHVQQELIKENKGDVGLYAAVNAGVRFRITRNLHLFLGPTVSTNTLGLHLGVGF